MSATVDRKTIAQAADVSVKTVVKQERKWGLHECRSAALACRVRYFREQASEKLMRLKVIGKPL